MTLKNKIKSLEYLFKFYPSGEKDAITFLISGDTGIAPEFLHALTRYLNKESNKLLFIRQATGESGSAVEKRAEDITNALKEFPMQIADLAEEQNFNACKIIAVGFFQDCSLLLKLFELYPLFLSGLILFRPRAEIGAITLRPLQDIPIFISTHFNDFESISISERLKEKGFSVQIFASTNKDEDMTDDFKLAAQWIFKNFS